ncbi:hypothetical protein D2917_25420 [Cupriavidus oxalaticus]|uniref:Uncharacterized protein n=1 Tax=Cupriavidus oxalaticus TaxID=96344 RepID=A0A5P3VQF0_9BURK|nr:hypothetical protein D2917_25420 [Cupriavidus oxalaticus]
MICTLAGVACIRLVLGIREHKVGDRAEPEPKALQAVPQVLHQAEILNSLLGAAFRAMLRRYRCYTFFLNLFPARGLAPSRHPPIVLSILLRKEV